MSKISDGGDSKSIEENYRKQHLAVSEYAKNLSMSLEEEKKKTKRSMEINRQLLVELKKAHSQIGRLKKQTEKQDFKEIVTRLQADNKDLQTEIEQLKESMRMKPLQSQQHEKLLQKGLDEEEADENSRLLKNGGNMGTPSKDKSNGTKNALDRENELLKVQLLNQKENIIYYQRKLREMKRQLNQYMQVGVTAMISPSSPTKREDPEGLSRTYSSTDIKPLDENDEKKQREISELEIDLKNVRRKYDRMKEDNRVLFQSVRKLKKENSEREKRETERIQRMVLLQKEVLRKNDLMEKFSNKNRLLTNEIAELEKKYKGEEFANAHRFKKMINVLRQRIQESDNNPFPGGIVDRTVNKTPTKKKTRQKEENDVHDGKKSQPEVVGENE